jgi:glucosyl-3-phosphoglycerate synthase
MDRVAEDWFARRTWQDPDWSVADLVAAKAGRKVSVVLPALDEEATVGAIVEAVGSLTRHPSPLVDELVVVDSGSTDRTVEVARAAGARVVLRTDVLPELEPVPGKGEVLWRSLAATSGDVLCFLDSDLVDFDPGFVPALLGPLLTTPGIGLVKGFYRRPLRLETTQADTGGGRR